MRGDDPSLRDLGVDKAVGLQPDLIPARETRGGPIRGIPVQKSRAVLHLRPIDRGLQRPRLARPGLPPVPRQITRTRWLGGLRLRLHWGIIRNARDASRPRQGGSDGSCRGRRRGKREEGSEGAGAFSDGRRSATRSLTFGELLPEIGLVVGIAGRVSGRRTLLRGGDELIVGDAEREVTGTRARRERIRLHAAAQAKDRVDDPGQKKGRFSRLGEASQIAKMHPLAVSRCERRRPREVVLDLSQRPLAVLHAVSISRRGSSVSRSSRRQDFREASPVQKKAPKSSRDVAIEQHVRHRVGLISTLLWAPR
jgi:hypothetical protein